MTLVNVGYAKPTAVVEIERLGFKWTEVADFDLTRLSVNRRVQTRDAEHYAPKETVAQFAIAMGEVSFPPIVVTKDDWIVDGNTRIGAKLKRREKFSPAIVVEAVFEGTSRRQENLLHALAATLNQTGGLRLTPKEIRKVATRLIELNWRTDQIGRAIGLSVSGVTQVKKELEATKKLERVGLQLNGGVRGASLRALGARDVVDLNDVPFRELATLAMDASLNASEIMTVAKDARATGSDTGAVDLLSQLRTEMGDRIQERRLTGVGKPPVSRQLRQHLGFVNKFVGREQELLETNPKVSAMHVEALENAVTLLTAVLAMQKG